ncbi:putative ribonuclease H-like domain-containing protein [Tanacetum coccineum]
MLRGQVPVNAVKQSSPRVAASISTTKTINTAAPKSKVNDALRKTIKGFLTMDALDFKLLVESQILLKVPKQNNMYIFYLKNVVPLRGLTCLFAKAIIDESDLWHMRLGHINFKTINKLVRGNLVRGLPSKLFENDHTCVACQKESNTKPLGVYPYLLFDIDLLTNSMNYEPVTAGNQTKKNASIEDNVDVVPTQRYILLPLLYDSPQSSEDALIHLNTVLFPQPEIRKKDHPKDQIIGDINSATQTRRMTKITKEHAMNFCRSVDFTQKAKYAIGTKWDYKNKKDKRGIVVRNKMDVKSAFLYGTIEDEVYVCQPPCFEDPQFSKKVYKVEKALYGLHQAPRAWYETLSTYLLENGFRRGTIDKTLFIKKDKDDAQEIQMSSIRELTFFLGNKQQASILRLTIINQRIEEAEDVDVHFMQVTELDHYVLIASRPDIMFVVCACARFQVTPKVSHLHVVKRIFRYLKGQSKLGLWYPRDSPFDLEAFSDSDYAGASLDRKSQQKVVNFLAKGVVDPKSDA